MPGSGHRLPGERKRRQIIVAQGLSGPASPKRTTGDLVLCKPERLCYTLPAREPLFRLFLGSSAVEHSTVNRMVAGSNPARGASKISHLPEQSQIDAKPRVGIVWANQLPEGPDRPEPPPLFPRVSCENCETAAPISTGVVRPPPVRERDQSRMIALRDYGNGMSWVGSFRLPCGQPVRPLGD